MWTYEFNVNHWPLVIRKMQLFIRNHKKNEKKKNRKSTTKWVPFENIQPTISVIQILWKCVRVNCTLSLVCAVNVQHIHLRIQYQYSNGIRLICVWLRIDMFFIWHWKAAIFLLYGLTGKNDVTRTKSSVSSGKRITFDVYFCKITSRWVQTHWISLS